MVEHMDGLAHGTHAYLFIDGADMSETPDIPVIN